MYTFARELNPIHMHLTILKQELFFFSFHRQTAQIRISTTNITVVSSCFAIYQEEGLVPCRLLRIRNRLKKKSSKRPPSSYTSTIRDIYKAEQKKKLREENISTYIIHIFCFMGLVCLGEKKNNKISQIHYYIEQNRLNVTNSAGNIKGIVIRGESDKSLLGTVGSDEGVDLGNLNIVKLLDGRLDLVLVGLNVNGNNEGVVLLNLLDGDLRVDVVLDDLELVESGVVSNRLALVLGGSGKTEGLGLTEGGVGTDLQGLGLVNTLEGGLLGVKGLLSS